MSALAGRTSAAEYSELEIKAFISLTEKKLIYWLEKEGKSSSEITHFYITAAQQVISYHQYSTAKILFKKALARKDLPNKLTAYIPLIWLNIQTSNYKEAEKYFKEAGSYLTSNAKLETQGIRDRMTLFKLQISQKPSVAMSEKEQKNLNSPFLSDTVYWHDIKQYLLAKNYAEAYKLVHNQDFTKLDVNRRVLADVIHTAAKKPRESLYCQQDYDRYPASHNTSYSMKLCGLLIGLKKGSRIEEKELKELKTLLKERYPENLYIERVARDLAGAK